MMRKDNLGDILKRLASWESDQVYAKQAIQKDRDRLAQKLRAARLRVKENKARNGGIYIA